ncbi:MAG: FAD-dependent oxidoreductase [Firmicutes bacterium]|nr:FAD-dependent oxidoreductase [Bacillota bacterium]
MVKVVVVGGGWAGVSAALAASQAGAEVLLVEKTDLLLGAGLVGGIFRNNGRFTAAEEALALGGGAPFKIMDEAAKHRNIEFPGHRHASLYDVTRVEPQMRRCLEEAGVEILLETRITGVRVRDGTLYGVISEEGYLHPGDSFVDCTGTSGPMGNCIKHGNGCVMCIQRCPAFGPRVSLAARVGVKEMAAEKREGFHGAMSGSGELTRESLEPFVLEGLDQNGIYRVPLPPRLIRGSKLTGKACQQYALPEYAENLILLDTGHVKVMTPYLPVSELRGIPGFQRARYIDPYAGARGNSIRFTAIAPRENSLLVKGTANLFCAGEKAGVFVGHTEAVVTGLLAGHNAVRGALGLPLLELPRETAIGDFIAFFEEELMRGEALKKSYTFSGSIYFARMQALGLYSTDARAIAARVASVGLDGVFSQRLL